MSELVPPSRAASGLESGSDFFRRFADSTCDLLTVVDRSGRFVYVNRAAWDFFGLAPEECAGRSAFEFVHPDDRARTQADLARWVEQRVDGHLSYENRQRSLEGRVRDVLWTVTPQLGEDGRPIGFISVARDITERKRVEQALGASEALKREILASLLDALLVIDLRGEIVLASDSTERILGWPPDELLGKNINVIIPEPYHSNHDAYLEAYVRTGKTWILGRTREFEVVRRDGTLIWCELSVSRADAAGQDPLLIGSFRDVTDRKRAERALEESERRFHAIFDGTYQYLGLLRPDGRIEEVNATACEAVGASRAELVGTPFWEGPWFRREGIPERVRRAVEEAAAGEFVRFELDVPARDGGRRALDFSIQPVRDAAGRVAMLIPEGRDITEIKRVQRAETAMLRSLATIGENAALLAHEIKNPLTGVNLALRAVADHLGEDQKAVLEDLASRMRRLEALMRRTLTFARPLELHRVRCSAQALVEGVVAGFREEAKERGTRLELDLPAAEACVWIDTERMEEVLTNLLRNALETEHPRAGRVRIAMLRRADEVEIAVEDDGPGIPPSARETVFRPFETTKSNGTGLGLAIVRKIVEEHGGHVTVEPGSLGGACFLVTIPLSGITG